MDAIDVATDVTVELSVVDSRGDERRRREDCSKGCRKRVERAGRVVSTSEVYVISIEDVAYRARVAEVNTLCEGESDRHRVSLFPSPRGHGATFCAFER